LKWGKAGGTLVSMLVSVGAYALIFPWTTAIGLVIMIFIHEMGHVLAARRKGLDVSAPAFIPFVGALITLKKQPRDAVTEAYIAYAGPLIGTLGAVACYALAVVTDYPALYPIAAIGFLINLFNLLPIHPLDGGRIVTAISRWLWAIGLVVGLILIIYTFSPLLILVWLMFAWQLWESYAARRRGNRRQGVIKVDVERRAFEEAGLLVPGEEHRRDLPYSLVCDVATREHRIEITYPGLGVIHTATGFGGAFERIRLVRTQPAGVNGEIVRLHLLVDYVPSPEEDPTLLKSQEYYSVPPRVRLGYGIAYFGLAAFLIFMLALLGQAPMQPPVVAQG
jgi:Zn-dependent protease